MTKDDAERTRQASKDALKAVYYVVIGIAITEALSRAVVDRGTGDFLGWRAFDAQHCVSSMLLVAFLPTAIRFVHGASIHLDALSDKSYKLGLDFLGFLTQGSLFYLMATAIGRPRAFTILFSAMLVFDAVWIVILLVSRLITLGAIERQWLVSDLVTSGAMVGVIFCADWTHRGPVVVIVSLAVAGAVLDYWMNRAFYFPKVAESASIKPDVIS